MPRKITITQADGENQEIEVPDGFRHESEVAGWKPKDQYEQLIQDRLERERKAFPDRLLKDEAFREKALREWKASLAGDAQKSDTKVDDQIEQARKSILEKEVSPREARIKELEQALTQAETRELGGQIRAEAPRFFQPAFYEEINGREPVVLTAFLSHFGKHTDGKWYVKNAKGDGFEVSTSGETTYKTVKEYLQELSQSDAFRPFAKAQGTGVSNARPAARPGAPAAANGRLSAADRIRLGVENSRR